MDAFRRSVLAVFVAGLMSPTLCHAQEWARNMFGEARHDFGTIARNAVAVHEFVFQNKYLEDVHITGVRVSCGCTTATVKDNITTLKAYEKGAIVAKINSDKFLGQRGATITVSIDKPFRAEVPLQVAVYIRDDIQLNPGVVQFGSVPQGSLAYRIVDVGLSNPGVQIAEVRSSLSYVVTRVSPQPGMASHYKLETWLLESAPAGYLNDHLVMRLTDGRTQFPVPVQASVVSTVTVTPQWLYFGILEPGKTATRSVVVRGNKPFTIRDAKADAPGVKVDLSGAQTPKLVHVLPVTIEAGDRPGKSAGKITVETDLADTKVALSVEATVAAAALAGNPGTAAPPGGTGTGPGVAVRRPSTGVTPYTATRPIETPPSPR